MKVRVLMAFSLVALVGFGVISTRLLSANEEDAKRTSPVVVELFTSQGCSSCPPADKLLKSLSSDDTLVLSFHVDYWNQLGWRDPFSSEQFTVRQRQYAGLFRLNQVYTPQMIVAGESEFVGSNKKLAIGALAKAKQSPIEQSVRITVSKSDTNTFKVKYVTKGVPQGAIMNLAVAQKSASTKVTAGENSRSSLSHVNVVRTFKTIPLELNSEGETEIEFPNDVSTNQLIIVSYVQDPTTGKIGAAVQQTVE